MKNRFITTFHSPAKRMLSFALGSSLLFVNLQAQTSQSRRKEDFDLHRFEQLTIRIAAPADTFSLLNLCGIQVIDARADIAHIGLMQKKIVDPFLGALNNAVRNQAEQRINKMPTFITLGTGLQQEAKQFAAASAVFSNNNSLPGILMVIKKLWLSDELNLDGNTHTGGRLTGPAGKDVWTSGIDIKVEFYLDYRGTYYAMYRYDSIITDVMTTSEYAPEFVARALRLSMQRLPEMNAKINSILARRKFSMEEIRLHNEEAFNLPILKENMLKKGVYLTFSEFKNNNPSQTGFELKKDKLTDILYIKEEDGTETVPRDVWGYSDGENAFVKSADNFFLLQRSANAFYIYGAKTIKRTESTSYAGTPAYYSGSGGFYGPPIYNTSSKTAIQLEPFQLDWSTGKLY